MEQGFSPAMLIMGGALAQQYINLKLVDEPERLKAPDDRNTNAALKALLHPKSKPSQRHNSRLTTTVHSNPYDVSEILS